MKYKLMIGGLITCCIIFVMMEHYIAKLEHENIRLKIEIEEFKKNNDVIKLAEEINNIGYNVVDYVAGLEDQIVELCISNDNKTKEIKELQKLINESSKKKNTKKYRLRDNSLNKIQQKRADKIAYNTYKNYKKYGVLPSIAVAQSMQETSLGTDKTSATPHYGWWGVTSIHGGYMKYDTFKEALLSYLGTLNNGRYNGCLNEYNYTKASQAIQDGGYCEPPAGYANEIVKNINQYNFRKYDEYYLGL